MPEYIINDGCEVPDTINPTGIVPITISTTGTNIFNFITYSQPTTLSYVTSSDVNSTYWDLPHTSSLQVGDVAFLFGRNMTIPTSSYTNTTPWYPVGDLPAYMKELKTTEDISATYTSSAVFGNLGIFRPNIPACQIEVYSSSIDGGGSISSPPAYLDKEFKPAYFGQVAGKPTIAFIYYAANSPIEQSNRYSSIPLCNGLNSNNCMDELENRTSTTKSQYIRYKIYNTGQPVPNIPDQPGVDYILCNMGSNSTMTYFSVTFT